MCPVVSPQHKKLLLGSIPALVILTLVIGSQQLLPNVFMQTQFSTITYPEMENAIEIAQMQKRPKKISTKKIATKQRK